MSEFLTIHPQNPQPRLIKQAAEIVQNGGVIVYPTDSSYALGCKIGHKAAVDKIKQLRRLDDKHNFTLVCPNLSKLGLFAKVDTAAFRLLKANTPSAYTFILQASREVPRILLHPKRRTIGLRVLANPIARALLNELDEAILSSSLIMPGNKLPESDPLVIKDLLASQVDLIIDGGIGGIETSTVVDLQNETPQILRTGVGDPAVFS